jgi:diguanylate cyclase (GGDEF)-like protein
MSETNKNKKNSVRGSGLTNQATENPPVPGLIWFYGIWVGLAAVSAKFGLSEISVAAALFLLGGISSTNFFFILITHSIPPGSSLHQKFATYQTILGVAWTSAYFYFSSGSGDLVLGMYMTVMMFAVFYLNSATLLRLSLGALASYLAVFSLKILTLPAAVYPLDDSIRFLILVALSLWCYMFARQFRDLRHQLQFRNEELQMVLDRVTKIAEEDHLTKSYNRRYIMDVLARERSLADRAGKTFSVLLFDIDHFKRINDRYGHLVGDQILTDFARQVKAELRGMDTVNPTDHKRSFGRYGGEEFIAVLPDTDLLGAKNCADRIRTIIAEYSFRDNYSITVSAGVAEYQLGETIPQLLTRTDQALYQAKRDGRNRVRCSERLIEPSGHTVPKLRILK